MKLLNKSIKSLLLLFIFGAAFAQAAPVVDHIYSGYFNNKAVSGYDVIAYFEQSKPIEGSSKYQLSYKGADWYFTSQTHLDKFRANPEKYAPQYGGYCAWAMANNKAAPGNPPFWTIYNNKLYLNYDQKIFDKWSADKENFIKQADINWANMEKE